MTRWRGPGLPGASRNLDVVFGHVRERHQAPLGGDFANPGLAHLESPAWLCDGGIGASEGGVSLQASPASVDRVEKAELCSNIVRDSTQNLRASRIFVRVPADILGEASVDRDLSTPAGAEFRSVCAAA